MAPFGILSICLLFFLSFAGNQKLKVKFAKFKAMFSFLLKKWAAGNCFFWFDGLTDPSKIWYFVQTCSGLTLN